MKKMYHASKSPNLDTEGIKTNQKTLNSFFPRSDYIFLGTIKYILDQYFRYTPPGIYYFYEVDVTDVPLVDFRFIGQKKTPTEIPPENVKKIAVYKVDRRRKKYFQRIEHVKQKNKSDG